MKKKSLKNLQLAPLRIPTGWKIINNNFYDISPDMEYFIDGIPNGDSWELFTQDLLQLQHDHYNLVLDLGWYPEADSKGNYKIVLLKKYDWENPIRTIESINKDKTIKAINKLLSEISKNHGNLD